MNFPECDEFDEGSRNRQICRGESNLSEQKTDAYRSRWGMQPLYDVAVKEDVEYKVPEIVFHGVSVDQSTRHKLYGPGSELLAIYQSAGVPHCDACKSLAQQMNDWGVNECREYSDIIVADMLPRAKAWIDQKQPWMAKLIPNVIEEAGIKIKLELDINKAIDAAEKTIADRRTKNLNVFTGKSLRIGSCCGGGNRQNSSPFAVQSSPRFITASQLQEDTKILLGKIPHDITAIAGIARSGLSVATMISMYMHLPMLTIRQNSNDIQETGNGWRLGGTQHINPKTDKILIVDDTVMTGNSLKAIRPLVLSQFGNATTAAVYVNPVARIKPDIWAVDLSWPHLLEWNLFNSVLSPNMATDFDGILCHDCRPDQDDDGEKYVDFIENAKPLYLSRKVPIPLIVTARIEKYRPQTEAWLRKFGISWKRLVMHPAKTLRERNQDDVPAYKAMHFAQWAKSHRATPPPLAFIESEDRQARRIASISKLMVISPHAGKVY